MKKIELTRGHFALVDDDDYDVLKDYQWHVVPSRKTFYASRTGIKRFGEKATVNMHRQILRLEDKNIQADHIDGNGLNNQKYNLRVCNHRQNQHNSLKRDGCSSKYKGVSWNKNANKWKVSFGPSENRSCIGYYDSEVEAALVYNCVASFAYGEYAKLNEINL